MTENRLFHALARLQVRYYKEIVFLTLLITIFQIYGATFLYLETDFSKFQPPTEPTVMLKNKVADTFAGQDSFFLLIELDPEINSKSSVKDIRDPRVIRMLIDLTDEIMEEASVESVYSIGLAYPNKTVPDDIEKIKKRFSSSPQAATFFNRDFSVTTAFVNANIGSSNSKANDVIDAIKQSIKQTPKPPGIKISVTGMPAIRVLVADIIISDAVKTILLSSAIILIILILIQGSIIRGFLVFNPLMYALIWTIGTMGWLSIPLSLVTAGLGAMILGLGVEYSIFLVSKYEQERAKKKDYVDSVALALDEVGTAIIGSSSTTIIGFLALLLSIMPMMHDLGKTLALGIFFCVISSLLLNPAFIIFEEQILKDILCRLIGESRGER